MKKITFFAALLLLATTALAELPTQVLPTQDTYVDSTPATTARGLVTTTFASYNATRIRDSYFKFSISNFSAADAAQISNVKLKLTCGYTSTQTAIQVIKLRDVNFMDVDLNTLIFADLATVGLNAVPYYLDNTILTDFSIFPGEKQAASIISTYAGTCTTPFGIVEFDITDYVKWAIAHGKQIVTINMTKDVTNDNGLDERAWFYTMDEVTNPDARPVLNFTYGSSAIPTVSQEYHQWSVLPTMSSNGNIKIATKIDGASAQITIYDIKGATVKSFNTTTSASINTADFAAGNYVAAIRTEKGIENHRFIIAK